MKNLWQLKNAKNHLSEVIDKAIKEGPRIVTRRGEETAAIISIQEYKRLTKTQDSLLEFMAKSPLQGAKWLLSLGFIRI
jgi:prevent-host-death family protein